MQSSKPPYQVLLSFDLEEFDISNEFGDQLSMDEQINVTTHGMASLMQFLRDAAIPVTFFTTACYAQQQTSLIKTLAAHHEIASHTFYHSRFETADIKRSKEVLEAISGQQVTGFRMPRLAPVSKKLIRQAGYSYDASLNPTWLPGRYNNIHKPRTVFQQENLWILPSSVTPHLRIPLFWLAFKNLPLWFIKRCTLQVLQKDHYLSLYFHPWEFTDLSNYKKLPFYIRKTSGKLFQDKFALYMRWLQQIAGFRTMGSFIETRETAERKRWNGSKF